VTQAVSAEAGASMTAYWGLPGSSNCYPLSYAVVDSPDGMEIDVANHLPGDFGVAMAEASSEFLF